MKNLKLLALLWVVLVAWTLAWCNNKNADTENSGDFIIEDTTWNYDAVISYNDALVEIASLCAIDENVALTDYENGAENIKAAIDSAISQCQSSIDQINELWDWEGDSSLKDWIIKILNLDIQYFSKFNELLPYLASDELPEDEANEYNALVEEINALDQEMETVNNDLIDIQAQFAANHGYELAPTTEEYYN